MTTHPAPPSGIIDGDVHRYAVRVYYEDTDLSGITYHANYLRWFERARSDLLRLLNIDQRAAIEAGEGAYAVADMHIAYRRPAKLDDDVLIETRCTQMRAASVHMAQQAFRDGELLCEADLRVGFVAPSGKPIRQPAEWRAAIEGQAGNPCPKTSRTGGCRKMGVVLELRHCERAKSARQSSLPC